MVWYKDLVATTVAVVVFLPVLILRAAWEGVAVIGEYFLAFEQMVIEYWWVLVVPTLWLLFELVHLIFTVRSNLL